jgi:hypothetical protein
MTTIKNGAGAPAEGLPVANLHETRKALAASKRSHPAGKAAATKVTAAKAATVKLAESMAEKPAKAPAKKAAEKPAPAKAASTKIRWQLDGERDAHGRAAQHGTGSNGVVYAITRSGDSWKATATAEGMRAVLAEKVSHGRCYQACVRHHAKALAA